jgi:ABC-type sugar transport system substrate-binding protein
MNVQSAPRRRRFAAVMMAAFLIAISALVSACGSSSSSSSSSSSTGSGASVSSTTSSAAATPSSSTSSPVSATQKAAILTHAFYTDKVTANPEIIRALSIASKPLTSAQLALLKKCMAATTCETGQGSLVLGIADSFGDIPWRVQARLEQTAQAIQSGQVKEIIYTNGHANLQTSEANFRALMAKHVNIISAYYDFATAMTSLFRQAQEQGIIVTSYISAIPHGNGPHDGIQFSENYADVATSMADAIKTAHPSPGNAALFTGVPGNPTGSAWEPTATKILEAAGWKIVYKGNTSWTPAGELSAASSAIATGKPIDAILYDGAGPDNLIKGFQRAGKTIPAVASFSPGNTYFSLWKSVGSPKNESITDAQTWTGRVAVQAAIDRAQGKSIPGYIELPQPLVQTSIAEKEWGPTLAQGQAYLPPTFAPPALVASYDK